MKLSKEDIDEFNVLADKLIEFLCSRCHPHTIVVVDISNAQLFEGIVSYNTEKHWRD